MFTKKINPLKTDWTTDFQEIQRLYELLSTMDENSILLLNNTKKCVKPLYSVLYQIYVILRPLMPKGAKTKMDKRFTQLEEEITHWQRSPNFYNQKTPIKPSIRKALLCLQHDLMTWRQMVGLSVKTHRPMTMDERLEEAIKKS